MLPRRTPHRICRGHPDPDELGIHVIRPLIDDLAFELDYQGAAYTLHPTPYHPETGYSRVPDRSRFDCDWPYVARRFNGSGVNSYHYQFQVMQRLTRPPVSP